MSAADAMPVEAPPARLATGAVAAYALGSFGTGVFSTVPTVLLLYYCTEILRIPAGWAAAIVFVPKAWAIVWDPLVGAWSDRTTGRFGRRRPFLTIGAAGVAAAFIALFSSPAGSSPQAASIWVAVAYFLLATLYSLFAVPYIAVPAEIGSDAAARSRLVGWRMTFAMIGVLAGAGLAPLLVEAFGGGARGYQGMAVALGLACGAAMTAPILMLGRHDRARPRPALGGPASPSLWRQLQPAFTNRRFLWLAAAYLAQLSAVGALSSAAPYIVSRVLGRPEGDIGTALILLLGATTLTIPLWALAGRRWGERAVLSAGVVWYGLAATALGLAAGAHASWTIMLILFAVAGAPFAAAQVLPFVLVAHLAHEDARSGSSSEGAFTGVWTATEKLGLAIGPALTGLAISSADGDAAAATPGFVAAAPLLLSLLSLVPLYLSRERAAR